MTPSHKIHVFLNHESDLLIFLIYCGQINKYKNDSGREVGTVVMPCKVFITSPIPAEQFIVVRSVDSGDSETGEGFQMEETNQKAQATALSI